MIDNQENNKSSCLRGNGRADIVVSILLLILFTAIVAVSTIYAPYYNDSVQYAFKMPRFYNFSDNQYEYIRSFRDVIESQQNHYFSTNGRLIVHTLVQVFCGLCKTRTAFVICNTIVWLTFLLLFIRLCGKDWKNPYFLSVTSGLLLVAFWIDYDPAFQINYVWVAMWVSGWLIVFFNGREPSGSRIRRILGWIGLFVISFIAGDGNEAFSIPIGGAFLMMVLKKRFKLSAKEWVCLSGFVMGAMVIFSSPAAWMRFLESQDVINTDQTFSGMPWKLRIITVLIENFCLYLWLVIYLTFRNKNESFRSYLSANKFIFALIIFSECLSFIDGYSAVRTLLCSKLGFIYLILNLLVCGGRKSRVTAVGISLVCLFLFQFHFKYFYHDYKIYALEQEKIERLPLTDSILWYSSDEMKLWKFPRTKSKDWQRFAIDKSAPRLRTAPEALKQIDFKRDTNALLKIDENHWLFVMSKSHPAEFIVDRRLGVDGLTIPLSPRILKLEKDMDCYLLETDYWRAGLYIPKNQYLKANVRMAHPDESRKQN